MRRSKKSFFVSLLTLIFFVILSQSQKNNLASVAPTNTPQPSAVLSSNSELFLVKKVIDGDTIELDNGQKVRYIGMDTPETVDPRRGVQCYGKEASNLNKKLVEGKEVRLEKDVSETDKYKRQLRYVYLKDENGAEIFVNDFLVREGYAKAVSYPPDIKFQDQFRASEKEARENNRGLWSSCPIKWLIP